MQAQAANGVFVKLCELQKKYPDGKYWNHYVSNASETADSIKEHNGWWNNFTTTVTDQPCWSHSIGYTVGHYDCNYAHYGSQCWGFANLIFFEVFGVSTVELSRRYDTENVQVGDWVRFWSWDPNDGHSVVVIARSGNAIQVAEANWGNTCRIRWGGWYNLSEAVGFYHAYNYDKINEQYSNVTEPTPATPTLTVKQTDVAVGDRTSVSWNKVDHAYGYKLKISGKRSEEIDVGNSTSKEIILDKAGTYNFSVQAYGKNGNKKSSWSSAKTCTAHNPVNVTFKDYDGTVLQSTSIKWGSSATPPVMKERKGYTFQGWDGGYTSVTKDTTVNALYRIITYTVNFLDKEGRVIKSQKVDFGNDATPPEDTNDPTGYEFFGWENENYKNVYTDASNKTITVRGIYKWFNDELPVVCEIKSAKRDEDGYYVYLDLTNYDKAVTRGRAVVTLKTIDDKLVDSSESTAFSISKDGTKSNIEVFVPCDKTATIAEVLIIDSYSSGVPISAKESAVIDQATEWSDWSDEEPTASDTILVDAPRTVYRYRDKLTANGNTKTLAGYTWDGTRSSSVGSWSTWSWNKVTAYETESKKREVKTQQAVKEHHYYTTYSYEHWTNFDYGGYGVGPYWYKDGSNVHNTPEFEWPLNYCGTFWADYWGYNVNKYNGYTCPSCGRDVWFMYKEHQRDNPTYATQYSYRDTAYTYHFYKWTDWSDWSTDVASASSKREVETKQQYRFRSLSAGTEVTDGTARSFTGNIGAENAGKQITLYVYGWIGASDFTNQYIGQAVVGEDGSYAFNDVKLKMEPTRETGDFTVAVGLEGTTNLTAIGTIPAPIPEYTVNFYDWDGNIISTQTVQEGGHAVLPENPEKEGYDFIGWDDGIMNITEDEDIFPVFKKQEFTMVFVDWMNQVLEVQVIEYGDAIVPPEVDEVKGYNFLGWDMIEDGHVLATENLVITAQYEKKQFSVRFMDMDGGVIRTDYVEYGEDAMPPSLENTEDGRIFVGWQNYEDCIGVDGDVYITPIFYFAETAQVPTANYDSGEYGVPITLTLTPGGEDDVIFYYLNGDRTTEQVYTGPITVDKTCSVSYYASCVGKNDSEFTDKYYCINTAENPSEWMLYSEIPEEVKTNTSEYFIETEVGYSYKDVIETSDVEQIAQLEADGWTLDNTRTTNFTDWQTEKIVDDPSILNFEVETRSEVNSRGTNYQYDHYVYTNDAGETVYSPTEVDGFDCTYETTMEDARITTVVGFIETEDGQITVFEKDGVQWFHQTKYLVEYRSRYDVSTYYRWTPYSIEPAEAGDEREEHTADLFRYSNKNYHIVTVYSNVGTGGQSEVHLIQHNTELKLADLDNFNGYDIERFYIDKDYTDAIDGNALITESCTLYTKYEPKQYTVVFQMQDGTEIDMQTVNYLEAATVPEMYQINGYVFAGWDKDFNCITEDTVITGRYIRESEYARVALNMATAKMYQGSYIELAATITPDGLDGEALEWSTSDSTVALVDDAGVVKAVGAGEATITVTVLSTKEKAECEVTVFADVNNHLILSPDATVGIDAKGYLRGIKSSKNENECTTVADLKKQFKNEDLVFVNINDEILSDDDLVGTGTVAMIKNGDVIVDSIICVVTGDMDGDGVVTNRDVGMFCRHLVNKYAATNAQIIAMDANGDGVIGNKDASMFAQYLVGKYDF